MSSVRYSFAVYVLWKHEQRLDSSSLEYFHKEKSFVIPILDIPLAKHQSDEFPVKEFPWISGLQHSSIQLVRGRGTILASHQKSWSVRVSLQRLLCSPVADRVGLLLDLRCWNVFQNTRSIHLWLRSIAKSKPTKYKFRASASCAFRFAQSGHDDDCHRWLSHLRNARWFLEGQSARLLPQLARYCVQGSRGWRGLVVPVLFVELNGARTIVDFESSQVIHSTDGTSARDINRKGKLAFPHQFDSLHSPSPLSFQPQSSPEEGQAFLVVKDCWICYDSDKAEPLIQPCKCTGDVSSVHHECLRRWLVESCKSEELLKCKVCDTVYEVERTNK